MNWLGPQEWRRDSDSPCISLAPPGAFDDAHILAPCVLYENNTFSMWYIGSGGSVEERVYSLGLATSEDGINFTKHARLCLKSHLVANRRYR